VNFLCRAFSLVFLAFFALAPAAPASGRRETHWSFPALVELTTVTAPCVVEQGVLNETVDASAAVRGARWSVKVPSHERVRFRSTSGSLTVRRAELTIVAETVSGSIHLEGVTGELQLSTRTGAIDARRVVLTGDSGLGSETGNVRLKSSPCPDGGPGMRKPPLPGTFHLEAREPEGRISASPPFDRVEIVDRSGTKFRVGTVGNGEDVPLGRILTLTGTAALRAREPRP
jgi:hypothetical protein